MEFKANILLQRFYFTAMQSKNYVFTILTVLSTQANEIKKNLTHGAQYTTRSVCSKTERLMNIPEGAGQFQSRILKEKRYNRSWKSGTLRGRPH